VSAAAPALKSSSARLEVEDDWRTDDGRGSGAEVHRRRASKSRMIGAPMMAAAPALKSSSARLEIEDDWRTDDG